VGGNFNCVYNKLTDLEHFPEVNGIISIKKNTVYLLVHTFIENANSFLIEDFIDYEIVRNGDTVMLDRLQTFIRDNDLEMPDLEEIKEHYKIIE
jgi:cyclopropane fatty-acyl-phospholipid synthase-like methyltransferase